VAPRLHLQMPVGRLMQKGPPQEAFSGGSMYYKGARPPENVSGFFWVPLRSFFMSVCLSVRPVEHFAPTWRIFRKFYILGFFEKSAGKKWPPIKIWQEWRYFTWGQTDRQLYICHNIWL